MLGFDRLEREGWMTSNMARRGFLKAGAALVGGAATVKLSSLGEAAAQTAGSVGISSDKARVFFTREISVESLRHIYAKVNSEIGGKIAIKLHSGEPHGANLLPVELIKGLQASIPGSTIVECNVLYPGPRQKTESHRETLKTNGFDFCPVDIMDEGGEVALPVPGMEEFLGERGGFAPEHAYTPGWHLTEVLVGKNLLKYDSLVVYTHFKGHPMGGFGGSLKNIGIGCASGKGGKLQIHGYGWPQGPLFQERMVESGKAIASHFGKRITYINVLKNISVDCDCLQNSAKPTCNDIGIVASTDILAIDKASVDLIYARPDDQRRDMMQRIQSRGGLRQIEYMRSLRMGNDQYELVKI
jgi:uncharacterized Fe-S center protein